METYFDEKGIGRPKADGLEPKRRISAYALVRSSNGNVLMVRTTAGKRWELPGGGIEMDETIRAGIQRECLEETGYQINVGEQPVYVGERNFYCTSLDAFFKSLILVYPGVLIGEKQDCSNVNTKEKDEIENIDWVDAGSLQERDVQPTIWSVIRSMHI